MILRKLVLGAVTLALAALWRAAPAADAPAAEKAPAESAPAVTASAAEKTSPPQSKLAVLAAAVRASAKTFPADSFDRFQVLISNNIFVRDRARNRDTGPVAVGPRATPLGPEEATVLRGIVRQLEVPGAPYFAYVEDVRTGSVVKVAMGDPVCQGKLMNPTLDSVDYVKNGVAKRIEVGKNLAGADAPSTSAAPAPAPPPAGSATVPPSPGAAPATAAPPASLDSIAEQMRQKRLKELGK